MLKLKQLNKWHESNKLKSDWKINTLVRARIHIRTRVAYHTMWIHSTFQISITTSTTTTLWLQAIYKFSHNIDLRFNFVYFFFDTTTTKLLCCWMQMDCGHANHALFFPSWYHRRNLTAYISSRIRSVFCYQFFHLSRWLNDKYFA